MKTYNLKNTALALAISLAMMPSLTFAKESTEKHFGKNAPFVVEDLPAGEVRDKLEQLSPDHRKKALERLHKVSFTEQDLEYLRIDNFGDAFYEDTVLPPPLTASTASADPSSQSIAPVDAFNLHSKPGATNVIYLDFDGHVVNSTAWNASSGISSYNANPFDTDSTPANFSATELNQIAEIWHRVAEDYAPFNVDVTTQLPVSFGPTVARVLITTSVDANGNNMPSNAGGGVAYLDVWGASNYASYYSPALIYYDHLGSGYAPYVAEAVSHEMGHNLSLSHDGYNDGTTVLSYFEGLGATSSFVSWAPIMGVGYYRNVTEWSKGEYPFATQQQDDIALINTRLTIRTDDNGNDAFTATPLTVDAAGVINVTNPETDPLNTNPNNKGVIETAADVDYFAFDTNAGAITINVTPAWAAFYHGSVRGANLDIEATLYDQNGTQVAFDDSLTDTNAVISTTLPVAGRYFLKIAGVGNSVTPYSDYGSLGEYFISGTVVPGVAADTTAPTPDPMTFAVPPSAGTSTNSITLQASVATDSSGAVQYNFVCVSGGAGCIDGGWQASNSYSATGLQAGTSYSYHVRARDLAGNQTAFSSTSAATTATPPDVTAPTPNPLTFASVPNAGTSTNSISMVSTVATDASGVVQYHFKCTAGGSGCVDAGWQTSNSYTATGLAASTSYSYQVQARDVAGNVTSFSVVKSATTAAVVVTIPTPPTNLTGSKTATQVLLNWNAVSGATSYEVWRCKQTTSSKGVITCSYGTKKFAGVTANSYTGALASGVYRYKVKAVNSKGASGYSNEVKL